MSNNSPVPYSVGADVPTPPPVAGYDAPIAIDAGSAVDVVQAWGSDTDADGKCSYYH
ncbi:hypothetical protein [Actinoalloteichus caeruleus]|uniref:hypothetical protein n=1 Tax=Actinoalloteichus cyanogriseus TaxID=2893586 RepID=UPI003AAF49E4